MPAACPLDACRGRTGLGAERWTSIVLSGPTPPPGAGGHGAGLSREVTTAPRATTRRFSCGRRYWRTDAPSKRPYAESKQTEFMRVPPADTLPSQTPVEGRLLW